MQRNEKSISVERSTVNKERCRLLDPRLKAIAGKIHDRGMRTRVIEMMENPTFEINRKTFLGLSLDVAPAGLSHHHSYSGGYVEHVVSTANFALAMCDSVEKVYHGKVNRDLVLAGVLLHDLFKLVSYAVNEDGSYESTRLADYLDHLSIAVAELVRRNFSLELVHIVASHHGEYGPIRPRTVEALICHLADVMDSRLNGEVLSAAAYLARRAVGQELPQLSSKEAFEIVRSKSVEGWEGVAKTVERIRRRQKPHKA